MIVPGAASVFFGAEGGGGGLDSISTLLFHFNNEMIESSGLGPTTVLTGSPTYDTGKFGQSLSVTANGIDATVTNTLTGTATAGTFLSPGAGDFEVDFWVFFTPVTGVISFSLVDGGRPPVSEIYIAVLPGFIEVTLNGTLTSTVLSPAIYGTWAHIAVDRSSGTAHVYVNGALENSWSSSEDIVDLQQVDVYVAVGDGLSGTEISRIDEVRYTPFISYGGAGFTPRNTPYTV